MNKYILDEIQSGLEEKSAVRIGSTFASALQSNPTDSNGEIKEQFQKAKSVWEGFIKHQNVETKYKEQWDKDYFSYLITKMKTGFDEVLLNHAIEVGNYIYKDEIQTDDKKNNNINWSHVTSVSIGIGIIVIIIFLIKILLNNGS